MLEKSSLTVKKRVILVIKLIGYLGCCLWNLFGIILLLSLVGLILFGTYEFGLGLIFWLIMLPFFYWQFPWADCQFSWPEEKSRPLGQKEE